MNKVLKIALASAAAITFIVSASAGFGADRNNRDPNNPNGLSNGRGPSVEEREILDYGMTGSITRCESETWDQYGNCVIFDPEYRYQDRY
ncbi:hypothetical protein JJB09_00650 [Rhizobium sp. KVB221]|uniref:DUF3551 domain-containing protein n=1 Tax=Rhizobium setariae TaxID=2801340 RepID=A0A937CMY6_9HYPH|nr:hypothetical protein [Rhizobium setariae]MBL0370523.1 hypothetical protein [Rhizobium setariae]